MKRSEYVKDIRIAFRIGVILKGLHALSEIAGGIALFFVSKQFIVHFIYSATQQELIEDPHDFLAQYLVHSTSQLTIGSQHFAAWYLLAHGVIKVFLVANLLREKLWAFPSAITVFGLFVAYQLFRFSLTHSPWMLILTILDLIVIWLTWREYRIRKSRLTAAAA